MAVLKISFLALKSRNERMHSDCGYKRGILRQGIVVCFQRRNKILGATDLTIITRWKQM
jgi:hypothetical protein